MIVKRLENQEFKYEYGCLFRRLMPWEGTAKTSWGSGWVKLAPGEFTTPHNHSMSEIFIIISGQGTMTIGSDYTEVGKGDLIFIDANKTHHIRNTNANELLEVICIWWNN
ncbi:cupin domain-containing protein [Candidatus Jidaibacter acanthamoebae]|nr:cupin domain-containing protein [Candidatus Jidaibacter acanthamoeba]